MFVYETQKIWCNTSVDFGAILEKSERQLFRAITTLLFSSPNFTEKFIWGPKCAKKIWGTKWAPKCQIIWSSFSLLPYYLFYTLLCESWSSPMLFWQVNSWIGRFYAVSSHKFLCSLTLHHFRDELNLLIFIFIV